jgi:hypothetical protein
MARDIEHGSVLSQEDYDYLKARERVDEALNVWGCTLGEGVGPKDENDTTQVPIAANFSDMQSAGPAPAPPTGAVETVHPGQQDYIPVGDEAVDAQTQYVVNPEELDDPDADGQAYSDMKVADLEAEIASRNEDREEDDQIQPASGRKADLIAALEADDEA